MSDHNTCDGPYARAGALAPVEARAMTALGCVDAEEANSALVKSEG